MNRNTSIEGNQLLQTRRNHRRWTMLVVLLAVLVSSGTFLVLRHNAIAATYKKRMHLLKILNRQLVQDGKQSGIATICRKRQLTSSP